MKARAIRLMLGISLVALLMVAGPQVAPSSEASAGTGVINTLDYGTELTSGGAWCWRGYAFKVSVPTTVTHIVGGPDAANAGGFAGGIYEAGTNASGVPDRTTKLLGSVTFPTTNAAEADRGRVSVPLSENVVLEPGQWYVVAQGRVDGSSLHFYVATLNVQDLIEASFRIADWQPQQNNAFTVGACTGTASARTTASLSSTPTKVAVGFRFVSGASVPQIETLDDPLTGRLNDRGNAPTALYMEYSTNSSMSGLTVVLDQAGYEGTVPYVYSSSVAGLNPGTQYYYRARAINDAGAAVGATKSFVTPGVPAAPTILSATPGVGSATLELSFEDVNEVTNVQYSLNGGTWISRSPASASTTLQIPNLIDGTSYSIRVRAVNQGITGPQSSAVSVTPGIAKPSVATSPVSAITTTSATVTGDVTNDGQATVTARGFVFSTDPNPVRGGSSTDVPAGSGVGLFSLQIADLSPGTTYYVRAYATNSQGTAYGSQTSFMTQQLSQVLAFIDALPDVAFGSGPFTVSPTTDADGLTPTLSASPPSVCSVTGSADGAFMVNIEGAGECQLTASQSGNVSYSPAAPVLRTFMVEKASQSIVFTAIANRTFSSALVTLNASAALPVTFTSATTDVCTVAGASVTMIRAGTCTITASQSGNSNFLPADAVTRSFQVTKASAQVWFSGGLVQVLQQNGPGVGLPQVAANPSDAGTLFVDWHDGARPTTPGRYRVNLTLESDTHQATPLATFVSVLAAQSLPQNMPAPAIGPVMARTEDGEPVVPVKPPSEVTVKRDDQPVNVTVTRPTPTQVKIEEDNGQSAILFAARTTRTTDERPLAAETDLVLLAGGVLDVSGSGYQDGTTVEVWMFSEPELLGVTTVAADGTFTDQFDVPPSVAAGQHVIQLNGTMNGTTATGQLGSASMGVLVEVPASNDDPSPLRVGVGPLLRANANGPAGVIGGQKIDVRVDRLTGRRILGSTQPSLQVSYVDDQSGFNAVLTPQANRRFAAVVNHSVVLSRAATLDGRIDGLAPFTSVHVWVLSEPRMLGRVITNQDGVVELRVRMPEDVAYGSHTLQLVGTARNGQSAGFALGVWIVPDAPVFVDVPLDATHGAAITTLATHGHVHGFADGMFKPQATITRGHAATMMANLFGFDTADVTGMFSDTAGTTHQAGIAALAAAGVADGFHDGTFRPSAAITRGQAAMLLARVLDLDLSEGQTGNGFSDVAGRTDAAAINVLHERGFVTGFHDGTFKPDASITRGQFASMLVHAHYLSQAR